MGLLKAYCERHALPMREVARRSGRNEKSIRLWFEATQTPTRETVVALATALGLSETVIHALFGELTWFVGDSHDWLALTYSGDKPKRVEPRLYHFAPDSDPLEPRAEAQFDLEEALAKGRSGDTECERIEEHEWWMQVRKPSVQQISDMVCASYLADAGLLEFPGALSPGYNAIDATLRPFQFELTSDNALSPRSAPGSQSVSRAVAMMGLGWISRTLNLSADEAWPIYEIIAKRFPLGLKYERDERYKNYVREILSRGNAPFRQTTKFQSCDMIEVGYRRADGFQAIRVGGTEYDSESHEEICAALDDIINTAEASTVQALTIGPDGAAPRPKRDAIEAFFALFDDGGEALAAYKAARAR